MTYQGSKCETCALPVYDWGQESSPQGGHCADCYSGICARDCCAFKAPEADEVIIDGLCWECASIRWCPVWPVEMIAANVAAAEAQRVEYNRQWSRA